jgi:uncharacterized protein (TIGR02246 family)
MRTIRSVSLAGILAAVLLVVPQVAHGQDAKAEVTKAVEAFATAFSANDVAAIAAAYTDDAVVMSPGAEFAEGRAEIDAMFADTNPTGMTLDLKIKDLTMAGDLMIDTGGWSMTGPDGAHLDHGKYLAVWRKTDYGWKMVRDIWNSSMAPQSE